MTQGGNRIGHRFSMELLKVGNRSCVAIIVFVIKRYGAAADKTLEKTPLFLARFFRRFAKASQLAMMLQNLIDKP